MREMKFVNELFGTLTTLIDKDGTIWFIASQVATMLGYLNPAAALARHVDEDDKKVLKYKAYCNSQEAIIFNLLWTKPNDYSNKILVSESGLYSLVFESTLPSCKEFKKWVTKDVLPSVRINGGYISGQENLSAEDQAVLASEVRALKDKVAFLQKRRHELIRDVKTLAAQEKRLQITKEKLTEEADFNLTLYLDALDDLEIMNNRIKAMELQINALKNPAPITEVQDKTYMVDACGFVL